MKRLSAIFAAALLAVTLSLPVLAEPDQSSTQTSAESSAAAPAGNENTDESKPAENTDESNTDESKAEDNSDESKTDESKPADNTDETDNGESKPAENSGESKPEESKPAETSSQPVKMNEYHIKEASMTFSLPDDLYVITRDTKEDDPVFAANRSTKADMMKLFEENDIYLRANSHDFTFGITVTSTESEDTKAIGSLSDLSEDNLQNIIDKLLQSDLYTGCAKNYYGGALFLTFTIEYENSGTKIEGLQQYTVVDGKNVKITYQTSDQADSEANRKLFTQIMETVRFDDIAPPEPSRESTPSLSLEDMDIRYIYIIAASVIGLIALLIMIIVGIRYKKSKAIVSENGKPDPDFEPVKEKDEPETSKDIFSDTKKEKKSAPVSPDGEDTDVTLPLSAASLENTAPISLDDGYDINVGAAPMTYSDDYDVNSGAAPMTYSDDYDVNSGAAPMTYGNEEPEDDGTPVFYEQTVPSPRTPEHSDSGIYDETPDAPMTYQEKEADEPMTYEERFGKHSFDVSNSRVTLLPEENNSERPGAAPEQIDGFMSIEATPVQENSPFYQGYEEPAASYEEPAAPAYGSTPSEPTIMLHESRPLPAFEQDSFEQSAQPTVVLSSSDNEDEGEIVFAENTEKRRTEIEQIGPSENDETTTSFGGSEQTEQPELSAYEKRFGKNRSVSSATAPQAAASPDIMLVNTDEKRASKFEKHFGKLSPAAPAPAAQETEPLSGEQAKETSPADEKTVLLSSAAQQDIDENFAADDSTAPESALFSRLINRMKNTSEEVGTEIQKTERKPSGTQLLPHDEPEEQETGTTIYQAPAENTEKPKQDSDTIELEISKSADGSLVIGALNEGSGRPIDVEIRDASKLKEEREKKMAEMGFETVSQNEIYNARKAESDDNPFVVKAKPMEPDPEEAGSRFNKLFGGSRETAPAKESSAAESAAAAEGSNFEKRFGKKHGMAGTAAMAGSAAVAAVFDKAEAHKGKKSVTQKPAAEDTTPETEEQFFEGVEAEMNTPSTTTAENTAAPVTEAPAAVPETEASPAEEHTSPRDVFVFERDAGIIFEHASSKRATIVPMQTPFTNIPRLESVNAEEYHRKYEEMKKSMPRNHAYAQRFSTANISQPFVETPKPIAPSETEHEKTPVKTHVKTSVKKTDRDHDKNSKNSKKNRSGSKKQAANDSAFEYYTGYDQSDDPFADTNSDQELLIKNHKKKNNDSVGTRFKKSFGKFFASEAPEDEE